MTAFLIVLCQNVEEERLHIIIQGLVIQEKLGQQAEVLAEEFADISINLNIEWRKRKKKGTFFFFFSNLASIFPSTTTPESIHCNHMQQAAIALLW